MKIKNKQTQLTICSSVLLIFSVLTSACDQSTTLTTPLMLGIIQFPQTITTVPVPRVYYMGKTIPCESHEGEKKVTFDLPKNKHLHHFYLLITESISYTLKNNETINELQTVDYIRVPDNQLYKMYELELTTKRVTEDDQESFYYWAINEKQLDDDSQRIPDETIIVLYSPEYIETVMGGNTFELPSIVVKSDVVDLAGSEQQLYNKSIELQLASLNSDTIHAPLKHAIKQIGHRTLIAPTA